MHSFQYRRADSVEDAIRQASAARTDAPARFIAGGTNLLDLMKLEVEQPATLIDINGLPLDRIDPLPDGGLCIGALVRNTDLARHPRVIRAYPVLSQAILSGASAQLRNKATTGGNLLQRTRCLYFREPAMPCNKRQPGSGCSALGGFHRNLAILGTSEQCIAAHPSDMSVALSALEAKVVIQGVRGQRVVPIEAFFLLPGSTPQRETVVAPGELICHVLLPPPNGMARSYYLKLRDRASYEFALASAAVVVAATGGRIRQARIAMGGIGTKPWRSLDAEYALEGASVGRASFAAAAAQLVRDARPRSQNAFKIELAQRCLIQALSVATADS